MTDTPLTPAERDELAAEYALGVLDGEALVRARGLAASDPDFRADVARWSGQLAPLLDDVPAIAPPAQTWPIIDAAIGRPPQASNVVYLNRRVNLWRGIAAGATALAASLAIVLVTQPPLSLNPPVVIAAQAPPSAGIIHSSCAWPGSAGMSLAAATIRRRLAGS